MESEITRRRILYEKPLYPKNPLNTFKFRPYLGSPVFSKFPNSDASKRNIVLLRTFYSKARLDGPIDVSRIENFIRRPQRQVLVIWGNIGVGKTWFTRYHIEDLYRMANTDFEYGVIDMLRAHRETALEMLQKLLRPILEGYLLRVFGDLQSGFMPLAEHHAKQSYQKGSQQYNNEVKRLVSRAIESDGENRNELLLDTIELCDGPNLFIAVDNLDRALSAEQFQLTSIVARCLRHPKIYLIIPLRSSSELLLDETAVLGFFEKQEMNLSPLILSNMLKKRFIRNENLVDLSKYTLPDTEKSYTYPFLIDKFVKSEAGKFVIDLCSNNARKALDFMYRILYSNHIKNAIDICKPEACIGSLLFLDSKKFDPKTSYLINLFDNEEPNERGNTLIRFRVLEYFEEHKTIESSEDRYKYYFERLGLNFPPFSGHTEELTATS